MALIMLGIWGTYCSEQIWVRRLISIKPIGEVMRQTDTYRCSLPENWLLSAIIGNLDVLQRDDGSCYEWCLVLCYIVTQLPLKGLSRISLKGPIPLVRYPVRLEVQTILALSSMRFFAYYTASDFILEIKLVSDNLAAVTSTVVHLCEANELTTSLRCITSLRRTK